MFTLTLDSYVEGAAGPAVLVFSQAAIQSGPLGVDLQQLQDRQLLSCDGSYQLPILQPCERRGRASLRAAVEEHRGALLHSQGTVHQGLSRRVFKREGEQNNYILENTEVEKREIEIKELNHGGIWRRMIPLSGMKRTRT